jgi:aminoglycoside phosphotransferase (APT) family kinase protein
LIDLQRVPQLRCAPDFAGWWSFLPVAARGRVLCLDAGRGAATLALAASCKQVVSVPVTPEAAPRLAEIAAAAGRDNVLVVPTLEDAQTHAQAADRLDGLVAILFAVEHHQISAAALAKLVSRAQSLIGTGFVLLGASNKLAYDRFSRTYRAGLLRRGVGGLERLAGGRERSCTRSWPVLLSHGKPFEVLHGPYRSGGGRSSWAGRAKETLLGATGSRWFAPGYIVLAQRRPEPLVLGELLHQVDEACGGAARVERQLTTSDKTILTTTTDDPEQGHIVVLPRTRVARERRLNEAAVLRQARKLPQRFRRLIPRLEAAGKHRGQHWFAMQKMGGEFVDQPVDDLDDITGRAADLLLDLHTETRQEVVVRQADYDRLCGQLMVSARRRHPGCDDVLGQIESRLKTALLGRPVPLVWMHGDFKIENVGIDGATRQPVSIIDWELSVPRGLPLLDLKYLLIYNRMIRGECVFGVVHQALRNGEEWTPQESRLLDDYCAAIGIDGALRAALAAVFCMHAIGARLHYDMSDPDECQRLQQLLRDTLAILQPLDSVQTGDAA